MLKCPRLQLDRLNGAYPGANAYCHLFGGKPKPSPFSGMLRLASRQPSLSLRYP